MIFIVLGPSGCGKGTQAELLAQKLNVPSFSTGELIRQEAAAGDAEALKAKEIADRGSWSPDELVNRILQRALDKVNLSQGFVLDGFPRNLPQATWLDGFLTSGSSSVDRVLHLETDLAESLKRLRGRVQADTKLGRVRSDETEVAVKGRFESYLQTIQPIKDYYQRQGKLILINNHPPIEVVHAEICRKLNL